VLGSGLNQQLGATGLELSLAHPLKDPGLAPTQQLKPQQSVVEVCLNHRHAALRAREDLGEMTVLQGLLSLMVFNAHATQKPLKAVPGAYLVLPREFQAMGRQCLQLGPQTWHGNRRSDWRIQDAGLGLRDRCKAKRREGAHEEPKGRGGKDPGFQRARGHDK